MFVTASGTSSRTPFNKLREWSLLILGTKAEDFVQGYEACFCYFVGLRKFQEKFSRGTIIFRFKKNSI